MSAGALSKARLGRLHEAMSGYVERKQVPGIVALVSRRGETHVTAVGVKTVGRKETMRRDTIFRIASLTKPITAAATMILIEECKLRLDQPIDTLVPELANRRVLKRIDSALDDTVPARRAITVRDLLTFRLGFGSVMAPPGQYPIQTAVAELGIGGDGPPHPAQAAATDEWIRRLGTLPLMYQPGERWLYNTGTDVLGVLIARVAGQSFEIFLRERIFMPLGMHDTAFSVPPEKIDRLPSCYSMNHATGKFDLYDGVKDGEWSRPPPFQSGSGGLVSTADDYLAFCQMMLNKGKFGAERILSRPSVELMTMDHLTSQQKVGAELFFGENSSWGFGVGVDTRRDELYSVPGRFGWTGGLGTSAYTDPREELIGVLLTQRLMDSPELPGVFVDFWTSAYQAIDD